MYAVHPAPARILTLVALLLVFTSVICYQSGLDVYLAKALVAMEGGAPGFAWEHNYWLDDILHGGGRTLVKRLFFLNLALLLLSLFIKPLKASRRAFIYIAMTTLLSTSVIASLKHLTTLPCPDALTGFGGTRAWVSLNQVFSPELPPGRCYPAGHASGGYAWICLAFLFPFGTQRFYLALAPGLLLGLVFGVTQQLRGYHFLSHDILTVALCWTMSGMLAYALCSGRRRLTRRNQAPLSLKEASQ
jgi:membrane-associated PAP2 superfamily phosphatase